MQLFIQHALSFPGHRGFWVMRSPGNDSRDYTVVHQFVDGAARRAFTASSSYGSWMAKLKELTEGDPVIEEFKGINSWFVPPVQSPGTRPTKMKMAVVTFVGVYPLTSLLPPLLGRLLPTWHPLLVNVAVTGLIVTLLTWVIMPGLTRLFAGWLFPKWTSPL
jgi:uncharacterized protein